MAFFKTPTNSFQQRNQRALELFFRHNLSVSYFFLFCALNFNMVYYITHPVQKYGLHENIANHRKFIAYFIIRNPGCLGPTKTKILWKQLLLY